jgi:hypothetical protein
MHCAAVSGWLLLLPLQVLAFPSKCPNTEREVRKQRLQAYEVTETLLRAQLLLLESAINTMVADTAEQVCACLFGDPKECMLLLLQARTSRSSEMSALAQQLEVRRVACLGRHWRCLQVLGTCVHELGRQISTTKSEIARVLFKVWL